MMPLACEIPDAPAKLYATCTGLNRGRVSAGKTRGKGSTVEEEEK